MDEKRLPTPSTERTKPRANDGIYSYETDKETKWGFVFDAGRKPNG